MIHVLGFGSIGRLVAHTLRSQDIPVTILLRGDARPHSGAQWTLHVESCFNKARKVEKTSGYLFEPSSAEVALETKAIETLIVCTKAFQTGKALQGVIGRLDGTSNILLLNNGIGVKEEVMDVFRARSQQQATILQGILSHGVYPIDDDTICHAGKGAFFVSTESDRVEAFVKLNALCKALASLGCVALDYTSFRARQLEKLLVNAVINPITTLVQCSNGEVSQFPLAIDAILSESVEIIRTAHPDVLISQASARQLVDQVITKTSRNTSSMLQDARAGRSTEIDYINGALCKLAASLGLKATCNQILVDGVKSRTQGERSHSTGVVDIERILGLK